MPGTTIKGGAQGASLSGVQTTSTDSSQCKGSAASKNLQSFDHYPFMIIDEGGDVEQLIFNSIQFNLYSTSSNGYFPKAAIQEYKQSEKLEF